MKQFLLLMDGMSGGGKTTVTKLLADKSPRTAIVGFDKIKKFVSDFERGPRDNQIAREVTMVMAEKYLDLGLSVIVEHPFKTEEEIDFYTKIADEREMPCYKFQLHADPDIALQRVVARTKKNNGDLTEERAKRNISLFQPRQHLGFKVIDTTNVEPQKIAEIILNEITSS
jgi:predicted kinase